jgi:predicted outer membrane repeat protein
VFSQSGVLMRMGAIATAAGLALGCSQAAWAAPAATVPCRADSLVAAMKNASPGGTVSLTAGCVYRLSQALPVVSQDLTIQGNGGTVERNTFAPAFTIFTVTAGTLTIDDLAVRNGDNAITANGSFAAVVVNNSTFADNHGSDGGAIYSNTGVDGPVVTGSTFTANQATDAGGAIYNNSAIEGVFVTGSTFTGNVAAGDGGAIWDFCATGEVLNQSRIANNKASDGGGVWFSPDSGVSFSHDTISGNTAAGDGGGVEAFNFGGLDLDNSTITRNHAADGGGFYSIFGEFQTIKDTDFQANTATNGGAIYSSIITVVDTLTGSKLVGNRATANGGGLYYDSTQDPFGESWNATGSQIIDNVAGSAGGGIFNTVNATGTVTNSDVHGNTPTNCAPPGSVTGCTN